MDLKMKGFQTNKQSIYIDCKQLLRRLYRLRFKVAKRHRDSLFDKCLFPALLSMIRHFRRAYRFRDERVKELDKFLFSFEDFNSWVDVASEEKVIDDKEYASLFEYITRIYESVNAYRNSARKARSSAGSNDDGVSENKDDSRGGDGFI